MKRERKEIFIAALFLLAALTYRIFLSLDFSDESYYLAMALRFALGDRPFVDELFIHQIPSVWLTPAAKGWLLLGQGTESIVLAFRMLYVLVSGFVSYLVFRWLLRTEGPERSFLAGALVFLCIPLQIPSLSYNTMGSLGLSALCFFSFSLAQTATCSERSFFFLGALAAFVVGVYPPLVLPVCFLIARSVKQRAKKYLAAGVILGAIPFALVVGQAGSALPRAIRYSLLVFGHGGDWIKLGLVLQHFFWANIAAGWWIIFGAVLISRIWPRLQPLFFPLLPLGLFLAYQSTLFVSLWWVFYLGALAPILYFALPKAQRPPPQILYRLVLPSYLGALAVGFTSASSPINGSLAMIPAAYVSLRLVWSTLSNRTPRIVWIAATLLIALLSQFWGKAFYRDGDWNQLTERVNRGPFRGLYTTPAKLEFLERISADILSTPAADRIFFYEFPAGYLISGRRPSTYSSWVRSVSRQKEVYVEGLRHFAAPTHYVFLLKYLTHEWPRAQYIPHSENDPVSRYLMSTHSIVRNTEEYVILKPR